MRFPWNTAHLRHNFCFLNGTVRTRLYSGLIKNIDVFETKIVQKQLRVRLLSPFEKVRKFIRKTSFPRATIPLIWTVLCESMEVDERHTDSTFSQEVHVGEVFFSFLPPHLKPLLGSIQQNKGKAERVPGRDGRESWRYGVITDTQRTSLADQVTHLSNTPNTEQTAELIQS